MRFRLPGRVPLRLRVFFRGAFALLAFATLALAVNVLQDEKQRSQRDYAENLRKNQAQIAARLRHPTGQLALLNPTLAERPATPLQPLVLPFSAIDFDDRAKALQAAEMTGCLVQYANGAALCAGVGNNPYAGAFVYLVGSIPIGDLVAHAPGGMDLARAHRVRIDLVTPQAAYHWVAPFEAILSSDVTGRRGRLTGFVADVPVTPATRPVRDFRGWLWQEGRCIEAPPSPSRSSAADACLRRSFVSVRLPVEVFRDALFRTPLVWPPADLNRMRVRLRLLRPDSDAPLFDSDEPGAVPPFSLADLRSLLLPGETLRVRPLTAAGDAPDLFTLTGAVANDEPISPWLAQLIRRLPVEPEAARVEARETLTTSLGRYELVLTGDVRSVDRKLATVATRLSWFVGAMLLAIGLTWLAIELRIIRRITLLTRRAASVSTGVRGDRGLALIDIPDLTDLRGSDELGVLAQGLHDLLQRVNEDVKREQIRAAQEKDMWHAVGHEIVSPLQSLMALHGGAGDASHRYIARMQQAVRVLYGQASPSEAMQSATLQLQPIDIDEFLANVARNAPYIGIDHVDYQRSEAPVPVRAEEYALEDVVTHVLRNGARYRRPGAPIDIRLERAGSEVHVQIHNDGPPIDPALMGSIFEYGVSDQRDTEGHRGQGLFVAKTYMAKMGGTIVAANAEGGVTFTLSLQSAAD